MPRVAADKREADFQTPRKRILIREIALGLFSSRGRAATTAAQIACEAGPAKDSLYLYFPNKISLLD